MVDIDHFKELNDRHGHQVGDQVLRMVASKLQGAGRGGRAYRYGGEEFTLVFPGKGVREAWSTLEAMRQDIAHYELTIRARNRPAQQEAVHTVRSGRPTGQSVSVTISIGVAERNGRPCTPSEVLRAADEALYRAKHKGRNQVSR
jgi:diguanylate cyclase (GGDEF)-like protein